MRQTVVTLFGTIIIGIIALSGQALAQQKTVKACEDEWRADKTANQAKGITQKTYVEKCRADAKADKTAKPATTPAADKKSAEPKAAQPKAAAATKTAKPAGQKTAKACEDEWRADKAANQAKGITEKAYVETCRSGTTAAQPAPAAVSPPARTAAPVAPAASAPARPAAPPAGATKPATAATPKGANQYTSETLAKSHCPAGVVVWANLDSKIYHFAGHDDYGHTKSGAYMCEKDALTESMRAAKNEKHP